VPFSISGAFRTHPSCQEPHLLLSQGRQNAPAPFYSTNFRLTIEKDEPRPTPILHPASPWFRAPLRATRATTDAPPGLSKTSSQSIQALKPLLPAMGLTQEFSPEKDCTSLSGLPFGGSGRTTTASNFQDLVGKSITFTHRCAIRRCLEGLIACPLRYVCVQFFLS